MKRLIFSIVLAGIVLVSTGSGQAPLPIYAIQGDGNVSPFLDSEVVVRGVVTAISARGFYIQSPDDSIDLDPKTSEGIFVLTTDAPTAEIIPGLLVEVAGMVAEYRPENDKFPMYLTEIVEPKITVVSNGNQLPKPIRIGEADLKPDGPLDQLERYEGMRIKIEEMVVVAPTGGSFVVGENRIRSNGAFYGVLSKTPRPFREPGIELATAKSNELSDSIPVFDMNPELIRVDSDGLKGGQPIDVTSGAKVKNIIGVIDYGFRSYSVLVDPSEKPSVESNRGFLPAVQAGEREITIASLNLENFFDDEKNSDLGERVESLVSPEWFELRLKKASLAVRNVILMPDVLGIAEVENLTVLQKLASRINSDAVAAGDPDPKYEAVLEESNDVRGIDVGFLVRTEKLKLLNTIQLGKSEKLDHPDAEAGEALFSRPPLVAEFDLAGAAPAESFKFTVVVNHFKSYRGIETPRVQQKRLKQAEYLAKYVSERQAANPDEKIILVGDFNAFQFNDGYNDLIGILKGKPSSEILAPSSVIFETGLANLIDHISETNRYSYVYRGSAQALDHILINGPTRKYAKKFGFARFNADFPRVYANDETRPERLSDHDVPVLYLSMGEKKALPDPPVENKEAVETETAKTASEAPKAFLFYSFDKKEPEPSDNGVDSESWIDSKTAGLVDGDAPAGNIFDHKGAGPNGAEWNPAGDLFVLVAAQESKDEVNPVISINGVAANELLLIKKSAKDGNDSYFWIKLPEELWKTNLRAPEDEDIVSIFGAEMVKKVKDGSIEVPAALNTGKVIKLEIKIGDNVITKYLHVEFGE